MKKTEVYVVVDSPKKAKKLKKVLDMFGERTYSKSSIQDCLDNTENVLGFDEEENAFISGYVHQFEESRTEVSIKELRNILAKEHLKSGDVVIVKNYWGKWVLKLTGNYIENFEHYASIDLEDNSLSESKETIECGNFISYATEEEKALLETKKELEVGKWYKGTCDFESLIFITEIENTGYYNNIHGYGFKWGQWNDLSHLLSNTDHEKSLVEATCEEVEQALIEEAKRRGFNDGVYFSSTISEHGQPRLIERFSDWYYDSLRNSLHVCTPETEWQSNQSNPRIFQDGKWATIIEQDNFTESDIAIVERLHDTLLDNHGYSLESKLLTDARMLANKIKSNIK